MIANSIFASFTNTLSGILLRENLAISLLEIATQCLTHMTLGRGAMRADATLHVFNDFYKFASVLFKSFGSQIVHSFICFGSNRTEIYKLVLYIFMPLVLVALRKRNRNLNETILRYHVSILQSKIFKTFFR